MNFLFTFLFFDGVKTLRQINKINRTKQYKIILQKTKSYSGYDQRRVQTF